MPPKAEFPEECALVELIEEPGAQGARNLKDSAPYALSQRIQGIGVHRCSSAAKRKVPGVR